MSKTLLVAQREFYENLRTKTFWLGILSFPILIAIAIFVGRLLKESKDVRTYAIVDRSTDQWLSKAIRERAIAGDISNLAELKESDDPIEQAKAVKEWIDGLEDDHPIRDLIDRFNKEFDDEDLSLSAFTDPEKVRDRAMPILAAWQAELQDDPDKLSKLGTMDMSRYVEKRDLGDLGENPEKALSKLVDDDELFAYFVIGEDPVVTDEGSAYVSNNQTDEDLRKWFANHATEIVRQRRIADLDLSDEEARSIRARFSFNERKIDSETGEVEDVKAEDKASSFAPVAFVYLLWIAVFTAANMLLTNTIEEKSNRLIEVLLSSVSPIELMTGKVLGIGATGLTIVASWIVSALIGLKFMPEGGFGGIDLATIIGDPLYLSSFLIYFLAGYLIYAAFLVAIGSVCNSLKEAQSLMQPVFIVLMVPLIAMVPVVQDPNGTVAKILTYIPLFTPFLMMNRAGGPPPTWEYVATTVLILITLWFVFWGAAKIFRVGILMTGKPPKVREILSWLRAPVGQVAVRNAEPHGGDFGGRH